MSLFSTQFSPSPVLTASPHSVHHRPAGADIRSISYPVTSSCGQFQASEKAGASVGGSISAAPNAPRGRKRSRDEASINLDNFTQFNQPPTSHFTRAALQTSANIDGSNHEIAPASGFNVQTPASLPPAVSSQPSQIDRPALRSHKSQRLDQAAIQERLNGSVAMTGNGADCVPDVPTVDGFTIHLGIGWRRISDDVDIQAAARGWARYIENHYPVSSAKICLESKGLQSYLVEAAEGYFLFAENLKYGRMVGHDVGEAIASLKTTPPTFVGDEMVASQMASLVALNSDAGLAQASTRTEMEMDH